MHKLYGSMDYGLDQVSDSIYIFLIIFFYLIVNKISECKHALMWLWCSMYGTSNLSYWINVVTEKYNLCLQNAVEWKYIEAY